MVTEQRRKAGAMRKGAMRYAISAMTVTAIQMTAPLAQAQAADAIRFEIAPQSLGAALAAFTQKTGITLAYGSILPEVSSQGATGTMSSAEALSRILAGSGMTYRFTGTNSVTLEPAPDAADGIVRLGPVRVEAAQGSTALAHSSATTDPIASETTHSYTAPGVSMFKGSQSLKETPQSVTVITRQVMDDLNLNTVDDVMLRTPGITLANSPMGGSYYYSRGFLMSGQYQYDGVPLDIGSTYAQANSYGADMSFLDRVEVLRGAAGMMKGAGTPAGGINFVRKRGKSEAETMVTLQAGSWQNYRAQLDVGAPLNTSGTLRGRTVLSMQDRQFFYDVARRGDQIAYAALDYDIDPATTVGIGIAYERLKATPCFGGLPSYSDGSDLKLSRSTCLGANWSRWTSERVTGYADLTHRFSDDWSIKVGGVYSHNDQDIVYGWGNGGGTIAPGSTTSSLTARAGMFDYDQTDYGLDAYIDGKLHVLGGEHQIIVGGNFSHRRATDYFALVVLPEKQNAFNPIHNFTQPVDSFSYYVNNGYLGTQEPTETWIDQQGVYANLRLNLADGLKAVLGGRLSWYRYKSTSYTYGYSKTDMDENGRFTPFAAVMYDLTSTLTAYASYAEIFKPQSRIDPDGNVIPPETGENYEIGIKGGWMGGALNASANLFRADLNHSAAAIDSSLCNASSSCSVDTGHVRVQGFEAEMTGSPVERMQVILGYTYIKSKVLSALRDTSLVGLDGNIYNSFIPRHSFRAWIDYGLGGTLNRWTVGGGINAQSKIYRIRSNIRYEQGAYALVGARIAYDVNDSWNVSLNGNNIFDKRYYQTRSDVSYYGEPRSLMLTLRGKY